MKVMLIGSAKFEDREERLAVRLRELGYETVYSAGHDEPKLEDETELAYGARMMQKSIHTLPQVDAVLCLNYDKEGQPNYIGGATFCEIAYAFEHGKKIFILNDLPEDLAVGPKIRFELEMFMPVVLRGKVEDIR